MIFSRRNKIKKKIRFLLFFLALIIISFGIFFYIKNYYNKDLLINNLPEEISLESRLKIDFSSHSMDYYWIPLIENNFDTVITIDKDLFTKKYMQTIISKEYDGLPPYKKHVKFRGYSSKENQFVKIKTQDSTYTFHLKKNSVENFKLLLSPNIKKVSVIASQDAKLFNFNIYLRQKKSWRYIKKRSVIAFFIDDLDINEMSFLKQLKDFSKFYPRIKLNSIKNIENNLSENLHGYYKSKIYAMKDINEDSFKKELYFERQQNIPMLYHNNDYYTISFSSIKDYFHKFNFCESYFIKKYHNDNFNFSKLSDILSRHFNYPIFLATYFKTETVDEKKSFDMFFSKLMKNIVDNNLSENYTFAIIPVGSSSSPVLESSAMIYSKNALSGQLFNGQYNTFDVMQTLAGYSKIDLPHDYRGKRIYQYPKLKRSLTFGQNDSCYTISKDSILYVRSKDHKILDDKIVFLGDDSIYSNLEVDRKLFRKYFENYYPFDFKKEISFYNNSNEVKRIRLQLKSKDSFRLYQDKKLQRERNSILLEVEVKAFSNHKITLLYENPQQIFNYNSSKNILYTFNKELIPFGENVTISENSSYHIANKYDKIDYKIENKADFFVNITNYCINK